MLTFPTWDSLSFIATRYSLSLIHISYAQSHGYDLVLDSASNPTLLYNAPKLDQTEGVIKSLK